MNVGLQPGDFIREVNGKPVNTVSQLNAALTGQGRNWVVTIERNGQRITARFSA
jgi:S1-C subfamily serine protease